MLLAPKSLGYLSSPLLDSASIDSPASNVLCSADHDFPSSTLHFRSNLLLPHTLLLLSFESTQHGSQSHRRGRWPYVVANRAFHQTEADGETVSGLSAAHTIYLAGGNVILLDKNSERSMSQTTTSSDWAFSRFLWWELDKSHFRHQRCFDQDTSRREDWR